MKKISIILFCFISFSINVFSQTSAPSITGIVVDENGAVEIQWSPNTDAIDFEHSEVWYAQEYDPEYLQIPGSGSTSPTASYFKYFDAKADGRMTDYYVINYNTGGIPFNSEPMHAIYLSACYKDGRIDLNWNRVHNSWIDRAFYIYKKIGNNSWELVDSTYQLSFAEASEPNFSNYSYKVSYKKITEATASISNQTPFISQNDYKPQTPCIISLGVNKENKLTLNWERSLSVNVSSYIIYREKLTGGWEQVDQIFSPDILTWTDNENYDMCTELRRYAVASKNVCEETAVAYPDSARTNLVFFPIQYDACERKVHLTWMPYTDMKVDKYLVSYSYNNGETFIDLEDISPTETSCSFEPPTPQAYIFTVTAVHEFEGKRQTVTSCMQNVRVTFSADPTPAYFRRVSVNGNDLDICIEYDSSLEDVEYHIQRLPNEDREGRTIIVKPIEGSSVVCVVDSSLNTHGYTYQYLLNTIDTCSKEFPAPKEVQTILLTVKQNDNKNAELEWTPYEGFINGFEHYEIERYINNELDDTFSQTLWQLANTSFLDIDPVTVDFNQKIEYRIVAYSREMENQPGIKDISYSNKVELKPERTEADIITIPNAFAPLGINNIYKPYIDVDLEISNYEFVIFNRWGEAIFRTNIPRYGWDGRVNGSVVPTGGYAYLLKVVTAKGDTHERRGSFVVVH